MIMISCHHFCRERCMLSTRALQERRSRIRGKYLWAVSLLSLSIAITVLPRRQHAATVLLGPSSKEEEDHRKFGFSIYSNLPVVPREREPNLWWTVVPFGLHKWHPRVNIIQLYVIISIYSQMINITEWKVTASTAPNHHLLSLHKSPLAKWMLALLSFYFHREKHHILVCGLS